MHPLSVTDILWQKPNLRPAFIANNLFLKGIISDMGHHSAQTPPSHYMNISSIHCSPQAFDIVPLNARHSKALKHLIDFSDGTSAKSSAGRQTT